MLDHFLILLTGAAFIAAFLCTGLLRRLALARNMVDVPNERSSHVTPTPRGGGLAIVLVVLTGLPLLWWNEIISMAELVAFGGAGGLVALIGWLDDQGHVPARWRLLVHFVAAIWGLAWLGGLPPLIFGGQMVNLGLLGHGLAVFFLVWLLNLYNFIDGIDGIAGIEAVTVCGGAVVLLWLAGDVDAWWMPLLLAGSAAGFLCWNFPKARIFMGDVGSGFVGLLLGLLTLHAAWQNPEIFWGWLILLGAFVVDATLTLLRRLFRGERVYEAHCSHAYQHAARRHGSHVPVSLAFGGINICWLLPLAILVVTGFMDGLVGLFVACVPLTFLALYYRAGMP